MDVESCKDLLGVYFQYGDRYITTTGPVPAFTSNRYANSKLAPLIPFSVARDSDMPQGCVIELFTAENGIKLRGYTTILTPMELSAQISINASALVAGAQLALPKPIALTVITTPNAAAVPTGKQLLVYLDRLNAKTIITVCQVLV